MNLFTASNGVVLDEHGDEYDTQLRHRKGDVHEARKEFYQHLRDKELGRWRAPEAPNFVVYTTNTPGWVRVVDENTGLAARYSRDITGCSGYGDTATRYFAAHPEPKPWHSATEGDLWEVEYAGAVSIALVSDKAEFVFTDKTSIPIADGDIIDAKRIWPEGDSDG